MQIFLLGIILGKENSMSKGSRVKKAWSIWGTKRILLRDLSFSNKVISTEEDYMCRDVEIFTAALFEEAKKEGKKVKKSENNLHV